MPQEYSPLDELGLPVDEQPQAPLLGGGQPVAPEQPDFQAQFEAQVLSQLGMSPEDIYKKKMEQYAGTKKSKIGKGLLDILGSAFNNTGKPYVTQPERMKAEALDEYKFLQPTLRNEAATIYKDKTAEKILTSKETVEANKITQAEKKRVGEEKIKGLLARSKAENLDVNTIATQEKTRLLTEKYETMKKLDPNWDSYPKEVQTMLALNKIKQDDPDYAEKLEALSEFRTANAVPSAQKAMFGMTEAQFEKYGVRDKLLNRNKLAGKHTPQPRAGNDSVTPEFRLRKDPVTGALVKVGLHRTKTGKYQSELTGMPESNIGEPYDPVREKTDLSARTGINQGKEGMNSLLHLASAPTNNRTGPIYGNAVASAYRAATSLGKLFEEVSAEQSQSNVSLLHTKGMVGGRPPQQIVADIKNLTGKSWQEVESQITYLAGMTYSLENIQMTNSNDPRVMALHDPRTVTLMKKEVERFIAQAKYNRTIARDKKTGDSVTPLQLNGLRSLAELIDEDTRSKALKLKTSETPLEKVNKKYGLGTAK